MPRTHVLSTFTSRLLDLLLSPDKNYQKHIHDEPVTKSVQSLVASAYLVWKNMPSEEELRRVRDKKAGNGGDRESDGSREGGQEMWFYSGDGEEQQEGAGSRDRDWHGFGDKDTVLALTERSNLN